MISWLWSLKYKKEMLVKENLRGWNTKMKSKSVDKEVNERDNNSNVNLITIARLRKGNDNEQIW